MFGLYERKRSPGMAVMLVGAGVVAVGVAAFVLLRNDEIRKRLGLDRDMRMVDRTSEDSFPAGDRPSWTPTTSLGSLH